MEPIVRLQWGIDRKKMRGGSGNMKSVAEDKGSFRIAVNLNTLFFLVCLPDRAVRRSWCRN